MDTNSSTVQTVDPSQSLPLILEHVIYFMLVALHFCKSIVILFLCKSYCKKYYNDLNATCIYLCFAFLLNGSNISTLYSW